MLEVEVDGKKIQVPEGSMVMHAADMANSYIPHFCYHKKLTIAANCRMCLVEVEKAPKPMPACATPVTQGMIVRTKSDKAIKAQQSVMEFLLINHPLDCPICDQGGECQLQDLAVGYGGSSSRYAEEKRVVFHKDVGPLISMNEMTRCIHCTRCVRFGQEISGVMELGMIHRGEHSEITTIIGDTVDSELSGNMIDICPVGALTSKPFRYSARTWELSRRRSISPHDSTGANLIIQVKGNRVMRVLPFENEEVNECWIADRDRFSYEALNGEDRLTTPMIKQSGVWQSTDWTTALEYVARSLKQIKAAHGAQSIGAIGSAHSTVEELYMLAKLVRGLGSDNIDHRTRHSDFDNVAAPSKARWLGLAVAELSTLESALIVGSFLRKDHPLFAQRLRQAAKKGAAIHSVHAIETDWLIPLASSTLRAPSEWVTALAEIAAAVAEGCGVAAPYPVEATEVSIVTAKALITGKRKAILLGNSASQHPDASAILALAQWIARHTGAKVGYLTEAANSVGAQLVDALPRHGGLDAGKMFGGALKACLLLNVEPAFDAADASRALSGLASSDFVVAMSPFRSAALEVADVMLPTAPFTETSGTFVNAEGRVQSFHGVVKPLGDTRPAWKVIRVLGNMMNLSGFDYDSSEEIKIEALGDPSMILTRMDNNVSGSSKAQVPQIGLERISDVPIYSSDMLVRRSTSLQLTSDAKEPMVEMPALLWDSLELVAGDKVRVTQGGDSAVLLARQNSALASGTVRIAAGHPTTFSLGPMFGTVTVQKIGALVAGAP